MFGFSRVEFMKSIKLLFLSLLLVISFHAQVGAQIKSKSTPGQNASAQQIETGKFRIYETKQVRGEESYEIKRAENGGSIIQAKIDLPFMGEEKKPTLSSTLRTRNDLTPASGRGRVSHHDWSGDA
jgi:hypothetical protein